MFWVPRHAPTLRNKSNACRALSTPGASVATTMYFMCPPSPCGGTITVLGLALGQPSMSLVFPAPVRLVNPRGTVRSEGRDQGARQAAAAADEGAQVDCAREPA